MKLINETPGFCSAECREQYFAGYAKELAEYYTPAELEAKLAEQRRCLECDTLLIDPEANYGFLFAKTGTSPDHVRFGGIIMAEMVKDGCSALLVASPSYPERGIYGDPMQANHITLSQCGELAFFETFDGIEEAEAHFTQYHTLLKPR